MDVWTTFPNWIYPLEITIFHSLTFNSFNPFILNYFYFMQNFSLLFVSKGLKFLKVIPKSTCIILQQVR